MSADVPNAVDMNVPVLSSMLIVERIELLPDDGLSGVT